MAQATTKAKGPAKLKAPSKTAAAAQGTAPKAAKPAKAPAPVHSFGVSYAGPSTVLNTRASRQPIDLTKFGTLTEAPLTDRDRKSLADLRNQFKQGQFTRANLDTGILRRLGERGYLSHVNGSNVAPDATFKLTARAFTPEAMAS